jgi:thiol:disulfide interchange protein
MRSLRWILPILLLSAALGCSSKSKPGANTPATRMVSAPTEKGTITWLEDPKVAFAESTRTGKPVLMDLWQLGCVNCQHLDKDVWPRKDIADLAKQFVTLKLNGPQHTEYSGKYHISGYPTTLFLTADGTVLGRVRGEPFPEDMLSAMKDALQKAKSSKN